MNVVDLGCRVASILADSRHRSGISQESIAKRLNVSKKTIQNWESGDSNISLANAIAWFDAVGIPLYPYIMELAYPREIEKITADTDMRELRKALSVFVDNLDDLHARELLYLLYGSHGSSPTGTLDMITAYLHMPLAMRVTLAESIQTHYEVAKAIGLMIEDDHVLPKLDTLSRCVDTAKGAVLSGKQTYIIVEDE